MPSPVANSSQILLADLGQPQGPGRLRELPVYGDEGHGLAKRANKLDAFPRALAFLARHLAS